MVTGRTHRAKGLLVTASHYLIHGINTAAGGMQGGIQAFRAHYGIGIQPDMALGWCFGK